MTDDHHNRPYIPVLIFLGVVTAIEIVLGITLDQFGDGTVSSLKLSILMFIALVKASTIVAYYMHVKYEKRPWMLAAIVFAAPLLITMPIALFPAFA